MTAKQIILSMIIYNLLIQMIITLIKTQNLDFYKKVLIHKFMIYSTMKEVISLIQGADPGLKKLIYMQFMGNQVIRRVNKMKLIGPIHTKHKINLLFTFLLQNMKI